MGPTEVIDVGGDGVEYKRPKGCSLIPKFKGCVCDGNVVTDDEELKSAAGCLWFAFEMFCENIRRSVSSELVLRLLCAGGGAKFELDIVEDEFGGNWCCDSCW